MASGRRTSAPPLTPERQLALWVAGKPQCPNTRNECCPDFSCCKPKLLAPLAMRKRFVAASQPEREKMMLGDFLGKFVAEVNKKSGTRAMVVGQDGKAPMTTQVEGWTFAEDGAPAARSDTVSISWGRGRRICIESDPNAVGETWIPAAVIEEIARRAKTWHWEPHKKAEPTAPALESCPHCARRHPRGTNQCPVTKKWILRPEGTS